MPTLTPRLLAAALALAALPGAASAERIRPLAPPQSFDPLTVPLPPPQPQPQPPLQPSQRVVPRPPRIVIPPERLPPEPRVEIVPSQMTTTPPAADDPSGTDLIGRGVGQIMDDVMRDLGPGLNQLSEGIDSTADRFRPALRDLGTLIDDIGNYQAPERLENGDIIIRRRADAPPPPPIGDGLRGLTQPDDERRTEPQDDRPALANPVPQTPVTVDPTRPELDL